MQCNTGWITLTQIVGEHRDRLREGILPPRIPRAAAAGAARGARSRTLGPRRDRERARGHDDDRPGTSEPHPIVADGRRRRARRHVATDSPTAGRDGAQPCICRGAIAQLTLGCRLVCGVLWCLSDVASQNGECWRAVGAQLPRLELHRANAGVVRFLWSR